MIDLRSDTATIPSKEMRETVLTAKLGDDYYLEDDYYRDYKDFLSHVFV